MVVLDKVMLDAGFVGLRENFLPFDNSTAYTSVISSSESPKFCPPEASTFGILRQIHFT